MTDKKPQDHKAKAAKQSAYDRFREEAGNADWGPFESLRGKTLTVRGRHGTVEVTVLDNVGDWDDDVALNFERNLHGLALRGMVSNEDLALVNNVKPSIASAYAALQDAMEEAEPSEPTLGEGRASQAS